MNLLSKKNFFNLASTEVSDKRYNTCLSCDQFKAGICLSCKCVMKLKTKIKQASCPLNKWQETYFKEEW